MCPYANVSQPGHAFCGLLYIQDNVFAENRNGEDGIERQEETEEGNKRARKRIKVMTYDTKPK